MHVTNWNAFDCVLLVIVVYSTFAAFIQGIIRSVFGLAGIFAGFALASWNYEGASERLQRWISSKTAAEVVAFLLIMCTVALIAAFIGHALHKTARGVGLGMFDRLLGGAFGLARGVLLGVAVMMAVALLAPNSGWIRNSELSPYFLAAAHEVSFVVPHDLQEHLFTGANRLSREVPVWIGTD